MGKRAVLDFGSFRTRLQYRKSVHFARTSLYAELNELDELCVARARARAAVVDLSAAAKKERAPVCLQFPEINEKKR